MAELKDRYAAALFEMSLASGAWEEHLAQAARVRDRLEKERIAGFLENPHIPNATKHELLENLFAAGLAGDLMGFLHLTVDKGREAMMLPTLTAYIELGEQRRGKAIAYVVSAKALEPEQAEALSALLSKKLGKRVEILAKEDPSLIGGFYVHVDGCLIDRTVRTDLRNLKESLKRGGANDSQTR